MGPKKSLGQNFLTSPAIAEQIVTASGVGKTDTVLEIGPGKGILTRALSSKAREVIAIEKDRELINQDFGENVKIIESDIRSVDIDSFNLPEKYHLVANIPYYITGEIIRMFLTTKHQPVGMTILVQKEVAQRIVTRDGKESVLSLSIKAYGTPKYVRTVKAGVFFPKPKVDSAILHIGNISRSKFENIDHENRFFEIVKMAFNSKRKTLGATIGKEVSLPDELNKARPENIELETWLNITKEAKTSRSLA